MLSQLMRDLSHPEYVHLLLNPIPIYGSALGALGLLIALFFKSPSSKIAPLSLLAVAGLSAWPVEEYGHKAESRIENNLDADGHEWFETHEHRAEKVLPVFYVMAAAAVGAIVCCVALPKSARLVSVIVLLLAVVSMWAGAWIGQAGGKIMHKELRNGPPPARS